MTQGNAFASLGPMLLARKGTAKPAMRVQLTQADRTAELGDDLDELAASQSALGWDDMGETDCSVLTLPITRRLPEAPAGTGRKTRHGDAAGKGRKSAFTLRLDAERHMRMRLAATIENCSAQALVTRALDAYLEGVADLDSIAAHVAGNSKAS